jgi:hypothetical protein
MSEGFGGVASRGGSATMEEPKGDDVAAKTRLDIVTARTRINKDAGFSTPPFVHL